MASLEIERICKSYGSTEVLRDITISMEHGEFLVLVGPSGCGKSTLLAMIAGLEDISDGEIRIDGQRVNEREPKERDIAMVFQSYALYPNMSVAKNIGFGMEMRGVPKAERERKIDRAAQLLQIVPLLERKPSQLSGGQRQRVAIGRALVRDPKVFLFDEPLSNLDAKLRLEMRTEIKKLHQRLGASIVYVTHDQIEAMTLASRIVVLRDGVVQQIGTPSEIYDDPVNLFVADFMGSPAMNLIPGRLTADGATTSVALDREGEEPLTLRVDGAGEGLNTLDGREVIFGIRPEAITDAQGADRTAKHLVQTDCSVEVVEPAGADTYVVTRLAGREVIARMRSDAAVDAGNRAPFTFNMDKAVLFDPTTQQRIA